MRGPRLCLYIQLRLHYALLFAEDEAKRRLNRDRPKIDLVEALVLFDGRPVMTYPSPRGDEVRFVTVGVIGSKLYALVWTMRQGATRFISLRRARDGEEREYRARYG